MQDLEAAKNTVQDVQQEVQNTIQSAETDLAEATSNKS